MVSTWLRRAKANTIVLTMVSVDIFFICIRSFLRAGLDDHTAWGSRSAAISGTHASSTTSGSTAS